MGILNVVDRPHWPSTVHHFIQYLCFSVHLCGVSACTSVVFQHVPVWCFSVYLCGAQAAEHVLGSVLCAPGCLSVYLCGV